jgi:2-oxo-4-hydroxy-4-carboxy-5-ureidoimidazoline decarboxylase
MIAAMTPSHHTVALDDLNRADKRAFIAALGGIFENAPWVAEAVWPQRPFATLAALFSAMTAAVTAASREKKLALIFGHPDLAGKAARAGDLTAHSRSEQSGAGLDRLSEAEYATFQRLNDEYRAKFGFPFILCVRRHTKASILREFERRVALDNDAEIDTALAEIHRIVALRLDDRVAAPDRLEVHGRLSTHVLDTWSGRPAAGVTVSLWERCGQENTLVVSTVTNADGRTDAPLIHGRPLPIGSYELCFALATYFAGMGAPVADPPFLDMVPIRFSIAEAEGHYHVPLLATPWSFATYRGS